MIIIRKAEFITSAVSVNGYPEGPEPEIALAGRSNVGKSSLINKFINRKNLARTGNTPGKTQMINFYRINDEWGFVDLPGYGYAKVSKELKANWGKMMEEYFSRRGNLRAVIQVVDIRHIPSLEDEEMHGFLRNRGLPVLVVATKADKISKGQWGKHLSQIAKALNIPDWRMIIPYSAETGLGVPELHQALEEILAMTDEDVESGEQESEV
ncbi:ribosome biogenesis GTP-binding protein YsxC/EngB [Desulfitobacterium dichloroeliminans LMG P-21439]|uniref:Probable GTP-binding protein EngB n=1 Tax=Desulfitobacterium dichloroeliminans (strain LMG P-21439 / DCA1) TaxID=871963 RepID=L0FBU3_DESDL|nr:ribosome biogenesis GTP-binding protein YihA/YsxC [Desulfitobacterium dichloroeliminans]AGA70485.1 ribosome biogenesis GTP-binding protein YsxC/EngB [Desulfitobacterium dichloroeliminans LMG P-21439]